MPYFYLLVGNSRTAFDFESEGKHHFEGIEAIDYVAPHYIGRIGAARNIASAIGFEKQAIVHVYEDNTNSLTDSIVPHSNAPRNPILKKPRE